VRKTGRWKQGTAENAMQIIDIVGCCDRKVETIGGVRFLPDSSGSLGNSKANDQ
jgi:hypothetical protein